MVRLSEVRHHGSRLSLVLSLELMTTRIAPALKSVESHDVYECHRFRRGSHSPSDVG